MPHPHSLSIVGEIQLILGPMFSGKTTELLRRIRRFQVAKRECVVLKYAKDTRYNVKEASTHDRYGVFLFRLRCVVMCSC